MLLRSSKKGDLCENLVVLLAVKRLDIKSHKKKKTWKRNCSPLQRVVIQDQLEQTSIQLENRI